MLRILLLEDDHLQAAWIRSEFEAMLRALVEHVSTELGFRKRLNDLRNDPPHIAVLDVIVRWKNPEDEELPAADDEARSGPFGAGLRCARLLRRECPTVPVILYTVLERNDLDTQLTDPQVCHLQKHAEISPLIEAIRKVRSQSGDGAA